MKELNMAHCSVLQSSVGINLSEGAVSVYRRIFVHFGSNTVKGKF